MGHGAGGMRWTKTLMLLGVLLLLHQQPLRGVKIEAQDVTRVEAGGKSSPLSDLVSLPASGCSAATANHRARARSLCMKAKPQPLLTLSPP